MYHSLLGSVIVHHIHHDHGSLLLILLLVLARYGVVCLHWHLHLLLRDDELWLGLLLLGTVGGAVSSFLLGNDGGAWTGHHHEHLWELRCRLWLLLALVTLISLLLTKILLAKIDLVVPKLVVLLELIVLREELDTAIVVSWLLHGVRRRWWYR